MPASIPLAAIALLCLHAAILQPLYIVVPGERTNLFTTLLAAVVLVVILFAIHAKNQPVVKHICQVWEPWAWAALAVLVIVSACLSDIQAPSFYRALSFVVPAMAGYWGGRFIRNNRIWKQYSAAYFTVLYVGISSFQLVFSDGVSVLGVHHHAMANVLLLLAAGPLSLLIGASTYKMKSLFLVVLSLGFMACMAVGSRFVVLLPFVLLPLLVVLRVVRKRYALILLVVALVTASVFFTLRPEKILKLRNYDSVYYRVEGITASLHIVQKKPFFGIGIRTPREPYLEDYQMHFDLTDRASFMNVVRTNVTADNMLMTMLVGFGIIPTLLYVGMLCLYGFRFSRVVKGQQNGGIGVSAIGVSLAASIIHFIIQDGLLYPQINWFFHLFIGLIPLEGEAVA